MNLPRFYPIVDTAVLERLDIPTEIAVEALLEAGAQILQFRHKSHWSPSVYEQARSAATVCNDDGVRFVVNDRADIALLLNAAVHVGQEDLRPSGVRRVVKPGTVVGYSTHNEEQLRDSETEPADYVALGPIFSTSSKINPDPVVGLDNLRRLRPLTTRPLVAIGGIARDNALAVWHAGADSIAVVVDLYPDGCGKTEIRRRAEEWIKLANEYSAK